MLFVAGVYSLLSIAGSACDNDVSDAGKDAIFEIDDAFLFVCLFVCFPVKKKKCLCQDQTPNCHQWNDPA